MFDIGASELLVIVVVAILVIGPKDMPLALRTAGRWIGKIRRVSAHFRTGLDAMIREAEMEEMEKTWKAQNEAIMKSHPGEMQPINSDTMAPPGVKKAPTAAPAPAQASAEARVPPPAAEPQNEQSAGEPELPLDRQGKRD